MSPELIKSLLNVYDEVSITNSTSLKALKFIIIFTLTLLIHFHFIYLFFFFSKLNETFNTFLIDPNSGSQSAIQLQKPSCICMVKNN